MKTDLSAFAPIGIVVILVILGICLIPNSPRIIITDSNEPSFRIVEVESDITKVITLPTPIRQSLGFFVVTGYCQGECCCGKYADGITASGYIIQLGNKFCATDPLIPFGKVLDIPGYGIVPVLDRGGKIKGNKIDVYFDTHEESLKWGNQELEIFCWVKGE